VRLRELLAQCAHARPGSRMTLRHAGVALSLHGGRLVVHPVAQIAPLSLAWRGEPELTCPGGVLTAQMTLGGGIDASVVATHALHVRNRVGGERMRVSADARAVPVSRLLGSHRTPLWQRGQWPLVWENEVVVAVPGIALDPRYAARADCAGYVLRWQPAAR
jgi:tRNA(Ile)-lysidine synthase